MENSRWIFLIKLVAVSALCFVSLSAPCQPSEGKVYRRELSLQSGFIQLQSREQIRANPSFHLKFHYRPSFKFNHQWQTSSHWWFGFYIGYGEIRTDYMLKPEYLPQYHTRLGFIARGNFIDMGSYAVYRRIILDHWVLQGKLGGGQFLKPGTGHYEVIQEGNSPYLSQYAHIQDVSPETIYRHSLSAYVEIQAGRNLGRHTVSLSAAYQRFGNASQQTPAYIFHKKYEIYTRNSTFYYANLRHALADASRIELVYSFRY